jgi:hypothetical protein
VDGHKDAATGREDVKNAAIMGLESDAAHRCRNPLLGKSAIAALQRHYDRPARQCGAKIVDFE